MKSLRIRKDELTKLMEWISTLEDQNFEVEISISHESGIGPTIKASIETEEGRGVWIDLTNYENW